MPVSPTQYLNERVKVKTMKRNPDLPRALSGHSRGRRMEICVGLVLLSLPRVLPFLLLWLSKLGSLYYLELLGRPL